MTEYTMGAETSIASVSAGDLMHITRTSTGRLHKVLISQLRTYITGTSSLDSLGFYGAASVAQPTAAAQASVQSLTFASIGSTAITGPSNGTSSINATQFVFASGQMQPMLDAINSLVARVATVVIALNSGGTEAQQTATLANAVRDALVTLGLIKGS